MTHTGSRVTAAPPGDPPAARVTGMRCSIPVVTVAFAALALAGCATSSGTASSAASSAPLKSAADAQVCKRLEAYPKISTAAGTKKYVTWLSRQAALPGVSQVLSEDLQASAADLTSYLKGTGTQQQVGADANKLQALCGAYGVG
jgi:hypothetical protein